MTIRMSAFLAATLALAGCSGSDSATGPKMNSALHADYVLAVMGTEVARSDWDCDGSSCETEIALPGAPPIAFVMTCEGSVCTFETELSPGQPLSLSIDLGKGFKARAEGAPTFVSDLGTLTVEETRNITHAVIPRPELPGFDNVNSAFSGWGDWGAFVISHVRSPGGTFDIAIANSAGDSTYENPPGGTAAWSGIVGAHTYAGDRVAGNADLTVDFTAMDLDVDFTALTGESGRTYTDMGWQNLAMEDGGFASGTAGDSIEGRFYGPNHDEAGGIFERDGMVGGFHTIRSEE